MNPMSLLKLKDKLEKFEVEHPKVRPFFRTVQHSGLCTDSVVAMTVTLPDGKSFESNIKLTENDMEMIRLLMEL